MGRGRKLATDRIERKGRSGEGRGGGGGGGGFSLVESGSGGREERRPRRASDAMADVF